MGEETKRTYEAFVTGSRRYGTPKTARNGMILSDIDLVVMVDDEQSFELLCEAGWVDDGSDVDEGQEECRAATLRFGDLNLILVDRERYDAWRDATDELVAIGKPVTRDQAIEVHRKHRARV